MREKKNTILVVDDEPQIQKMLGILLEAEHLKIIESLNGKQAIRLASHLKSAMEELNVPADLIAEALAIVGSTRSDVLGL